MSCMVIGFMLGLLHFYMCDSNLADIETSKYFLIVYLFAEAHFVNV